MVHSCRYGCQNVIYSTNAYIILGRNLTKQMALVVTPFIPNCCRFKSLDLV